MAQLLDEIEWGEPILPATADPEWEAEVKRRVGRVGEIDRRVAANPWVRQICLDVTSQRPSQIPPRLFNIGMLVTAQENSCRYCYGAIRASMKISGYSEAFIRQIERDADLAGLDARDRAFTEFCRNLARARPRPAKAEFENLVRLGFPSATATEIAFAIAMGCFYNRIGVLTACPPERGFERFANGPFGRAIGAVAPLVRPLTTLKWRPAPPTIHETAEFGAGPFGDVVAALNVLPAAAQMMKAALDGAFDSPVLSHAAKALMFAVVGRSLDCSYSECEARRLLESDCFEATEVDTAISSLTSARLSAQESRLLPWVRDTVHYQTSTIQNHTRVIAAELGASAALEAIGVAALANATVRFAMLLQ